MPKHPHVCIQRDFCPLCFRGGACTDHVPPDSPRINEEQRECSRAFGGLPLLDLEMPGARCSHRGCRLVCLVCGTPMAFECEPEFASAPDLVERYEEEALEIQTEMMGGDGFGHSLGERMLEDLERRLTNKLRRMGMAWHPRWEKLVHSRCMKKSQTCGCQVPVGVPLCPEHKQPIDPPKRPSRKRAEPVPPVTPEIKKAPSPKKQVVVMLSSNNKPASMRKALWIKQPAATVSVHPPPASTPTFKKAVVLPKPPIPKPNPKLQAAAKGVSKLDSWTGKSSAEPSAGIPLKKDKRSFNLARHERDFDMFQHGYLRKNGVDMYRFPDGTEVQVYSTVNVLTDDGQLKASSTSATSPSQERCAATPADTREAPKMHHKQPPKKTNPKLEAAAKGSLKLDTLFGR